MSHLTHAYNPEVLVARHARTLVDNDSSGLDDKTLNLQINKRAAARHARPLSVAEQDAESSPEAVYAFEAIKRAIGAAYNQDLNNLHVDLRYAASYYANHDNIDLKLWFLERVVEIFDCLGEIQKASNLSQILREAYQLRSVGVVFTLHDLGMVTG